MASAAGAHLNPSAPKGNQVSVDQSSQSCQSAMSIRVSVPCGGKSRPTALSVPKVSKHTWSCWALCQAPRKLTAVSENKSLPWGSIRLGGMGDVPPFMLEKSKILQVEFPAPGIASCLSKQPRNGHVGAGDVQPCWQPYIRNRAEQQPGRAGASSWTARRCWPPSPSCWGCPSPWPPKAAPRSSRSPSTAAPSLG